MFDEDHLALVIDAVIAGNSPAQVWADNLAEPRGGLVWDGTHCIYLAGSPEPETWQKVIHREIAPAGRGNFKLYATEWAANAALAGRVPDRRERAFYRGGRPGSQNSRRGCPPDSRSARSTTGFPISVRSVTSMRSSPKSSLAGTRSPTSAGPASDTALTTPRRSCAGAPRNTSAKDGAERASKNSVPPRPRHRDADSRHVRPALCRARDHALLGLLDEQPAVGGDRRRARPRQRRDLFDLCRRLQRPQAVARAGGQRRLPRWRGSRSRAYGIHLNFDEPIPLHEATDFHQR
jgi:hypothetical protein